MLIIWISSSLAYCSFTVISWFFFVLFCFCCLLVMMLTASLVRFLGFVIFPNKVANNSYSSHAVRFCTRRVWCEWFWHTFGSQFIGWMTFGMFYNFVVVVRFMKFRSNSSSHHTNCAPTKSNKYFVYWCVVFFSSNFDVIYITHL